MKTFCFMRFDSMPDPKSTEIINKHVDVESEGCTFLQGLPFMMTTFNSLSEIEDINFDMKREGFDYFLFEVKESDVMKFNFQDMLKPLFFMNVINYDLDTILEKIASEGQNSLTEGELEFLKKTSAQ